VRLNKRHMAPDVLAVANALYHGAVNRDRQGLPKGVTAGRDIRGHVPARAPGLLDKPTGRRRAAETYRVLGAFVSL
jgi:hypothetical protein